MLHWLIVFIYSWSIFIFFVDRAKFKRSVYGGLIVSALGTLVDWGGQTLNLYHFNDNIIGWAGSSIFYGTGPLFTMGVLFFQYVSLDRRVQIANVAVFSLAYLSVEILIVRSGAANYVHWHYLASLVVDLVVFSALSYAGEIIMYRKLKV